MMEEKTPSTPQQADLELQRLAELLAETPASPAPCEGEELAAVDFSHLDVLVGTVRSDEQFDYCMSSLAYYIPAKTLSPEALPVESIALYEEGLSRMAGIKRWGKVTDTRVVKRRDIPVTMSRPNPEETYYHFTVEAWQYLDNPIPLQGTERGRPMLTCGFLLSHCRRSYQLTAIRSPETYRLCGLLCRLAEDMATEGVIFRRVGEHHLITVEGGRVRLLDASGGCLFSCEAESLLRDPGGVLHRVREGLGLPR